MGAPPPTVRRVLLMLLAVGGCSRPLPPPPDGVVFVLIDALRADRLGCYGYGDRPTSPRLDALAADGVRFAHAISSTPWTLPSMATVFTSLYPTVHGANLASPLEPWVRDHAHFKPVTALDESRTTLAEILHAQGFATAGFINGWYPGPEFGFAQGFDRYDANVHPGIRFNIEALLGWLDATQPRRFFVYLHTGEVHSPYTPPQPYPLFSTDSPDPQARAVGLALDEERTRYRQWDFDPDYHGWLDGSWESLASIRSTRRPTPRDVEHLGAIYDRGIAYTDYWIGELVEGLRQRGLLERTAVIITSDHGDELWDHGGIEHCRTYFEEMMHVPLIMRIPAAARGQVIEEQVGLLDLTPTILDLLGVTSNVPFQGRSIMPLLRGGTLPERPVFGEASQIEGLRAVRTNAWKYVHPDGVPPQLYDLRVDPRERTNVCAAEAATCTGFGVELAQWEQAMAAEVARRALPEAVPARVDGQTRERLRQLGYAD